MKKISFLLFILTLCNVLVAAECTVTVTQPVIEQAGDSSLPPNQFPPAASGNIYVGSAPLTLTVMTESNSSALVWTWHNQLSPDVEYTIGSNTTKITHTFDTSGMYEVTVSAVDEGCEEIKASVQIQVSESKLEVPNVFSPNNDGQNDLFCVAFQSIAQYQCYVYNRWGQQVFHSDNPANCWDGRIDGGHADIGAYYYVIEAEGADGVRHKRGGDINLVR